MPFDILRRATYVLIMCVCVLPTTASDDDPFEAALTGNLSQLKKIHDEGRLQEALNKCGETPLHDAVRANQIAAIDYLLDIGLGPNVSRTKGILSSTSRRHSLEDIVRARISSDVSFAPGVTPLHIAAHSGSGAALARLLESGADALMPVGISGRTAAHIVVEGGFPSLVDVLVTHSVPMDIYDSRGYLPLHVAALNGREDVLGAVLKSEGLDINAPTANEKATPLYLSARNGRQRAAELLLDLGADVTIPEEKTGSTPLHAAVRFCKPLVPLLLAKGSDPFSRSHTGKTALDFSLQRLHSDVPTTLSLLKAMVPIETFQKRGVFENEYVCQALASSSGEGHDVIMSELAKEENWIMRRQVVFWRLSHIGLQ